MEVYRLAGTKHAHDLSGYGAALHGGRWNKKGTSVLYTAESKALALLEAIVHTPPALMPDVQMLTIEIPEHSINTLAYRELPKNWTNYPAPSILAAIAEEWIQSKATLTLKVPSCIVHDAFLFILNCKHPQFNRVRILHKQPFRFDTRLIN